MIVEPPNLCKHKAPALRKWESWADACSRSTPALAMTCSAGTEIDFRPFLRMYKDMRRIQDVTAAKCFQGRELYVRKHGDNYEFTHNGGGSCGNFAAVSIAFYNRDWVHEINGGHSALVRAFAGREGPFTLKVSTLAGTEADRILADAATGASKSRVLVHGMITYDYVNILRAVRDRDRNWLPDSELEARTPVELPVSLVLFGTSPEATESDELDGDD